MSSSESSGPQGQFFLCSLLPGGLDCLGVINVKGTSVSAAVEEDSTPPPASPSSLFSVEDEDDLFADKEFEALQASQSGATGASSPAPSSSPVSSVDDEDDLFGDKEFEAAQAAKVSSADAVSSAHGSPCSLLSADIDDEDLFGDKEYEAAQAASDGLAKDNNNVLSDQEFEDLLSKEFDAFQAAQASEADSSPETTSASGVVAPDDKNILSDQEFEDLLSREYDEFRTAQASAGESPATSAASGDVEPNDKSIQVLSDQEFEDLLEREFDAFQAAAAARSASESSPSVADNVSSNNTSSEKTPAPVSYPYVGGLTMPLAPAAAPTVPGPSRTKTTVPTRARKANRPVPSAPAELAGHSEEKEWVDPPDSLAARLRAREQKQKKGKKQPPTRTAAEQSLIAPEPEEEDPRSLMAPEPATQQGKKGQKRKRQSKTLTPAAQALKDRVETQLANSTVAFRLRKLKRPWENWQQGRKGPAVASASEAALRELVSLQGVVTSTGVTPNGSGGSSRSASTDVTNTSTPGLTPSATPSATASVTTSPDCCAAGLVGDGAGNKAPTRSGSVVPQEAEEERESKRQATLAKMRKNGSTFVFLDDDE